MNWEKKALAPGREQRPPPQTTKEEMEAKASCANARRVFNEGWAKPIQKAVPAHWRTQGRNAQNTQNATIATTAPEPARASGASRSARVRLVRLLSAKFRVMD
jgi:hypothetical protein